MQFAKLSDNESLIQLLTTPPFPNLATVEVATRCGMRALSGFSALASEERSEGAAWPVGDADNDILFCLRVLATCAAAVRFQDTQVLHRVFSEDLSSRQPVAGALAGHQHVVQACTEITVVFEDFFGNAGASTSAKQNFLRVLDTCHAADHVGNSEHVVETDDHSGSIGPEMTLLSEPLYSAFVDREGITGLEEIKARTVSFEAHETLNGLHRRGAPFEYWTNWFAGFLDGKPLDWELQRRVALIDNAIWEAGPRSVAYEITKIQAITEIEQRIDDLNTELRVLTFERHGVGGNLPPEMLEETSQAFAMSLVWEPLEDLNDEIVRGEPDRGKLEAIADALANALRMGFAWHLKKADLLVDTTIRWLVPAGGAYLSLNPDKLAAVIDAVKKLIGAI